MNYPCTICKDKKECIEDVNIDKSKCEMIRRYKEKRKADIEKNKARWKEDHHNGSGARDDVAAEAIRNADNAAKKKAKTKKRCDTGSRTH